MAASAGLVDGSGDPTPSSGGRVASSGSTTAIRTTTLPAVESHLASGRRDVRGLLAKVRACMIDEQRLRRVDPGLASFRDVDTADDLQTLGE